MKSTDKLMDMLCQELDAIAEGGQLSSGELDAIYKLIVSKEKLLRCEELESNLGYSQDGGYGERAYARNSHGNSYEGNSYGRHYVRGHYSRGGGRYSMDDGMDMMTHSMQTMINDPNISESDRSVLRRAMDVMAR